MLAVVVKVFKASVADLTDVREFVFDGMLVAVDVPELLCVLDWAEDFDVEGEPVLVFDDVVVAVDVNERARLFVIKLVEETAAEPVELLEATIVRV